MPTSPPDRRAWSLLALILLMGLVLRLIGIGWGLPDARHPLATYHPDELVNLNAVNNADLLRLQLDLGFYNYGTLYFYLVSFAAILGRGWGLIPAAPSLGTGGGLLPETLSQLAASQAALFLTGRLVTALMGTATIAVLYALGNRLFGRKAGLGAALLYALAPLAVVHAHFLTVDVPVTFWVALALLWSVYLRTQNDLKTAVLAGVWCGLAAATKYNAGLVVVAPLVALLLPSEPRATAPRKEGPLPLLAALLLVTVLAFLLGCPGPLLNWDAFWNGLPNYPGSGVRYELFEHSRTGHGYLFVQTGNGWWYHLFVSLRYGLGSVLLLAFLLSLLARSRRISRQEIPLLAFCLLFFVVSGFSAVRFARYMLPLFPVICVVVAAPLASLRRDRLPLLLIACLVVGFTASYTGRLVGSMAQRDPRDLAADYLEQHVPPQAVVAFGTVPWFYSPPLSWRFGALAAPMRMQATQETTRYQLRLSASEWDTALLNPPPDYLILSNLETQHPARLNLPAYRQFMQAIPTPNTPQVFRHPLIWRPLSPLFQPLGERSIPEDLLYIQPEVTLYEWRR